MIPEGPALPSPLGRRGVALLGLAALFRLGLGLARLAADPARFTNFEESYNATVAWMWAHGALLRDPLLLQYRSFCGGCSAVAALGVPLFHGGDALWRWKFVPLLWAAATQIVGFFALDRALGRAAGWAWLVLSLVPTVAGLDLSLMAWGNHQETALFAVSAVLLVATERRAAAGLVLGVGVWFCRTAAYEALVLLPYALLRPGGRTRTLLAFIAGLSLLALPSAGGDAGWYRMDDTIGGPTTPLARRVATLLGPHELASRMWLPVADFSVGAGLVLAGFAVALLVCLRAPRARGLALLPAAFFVAYVRTNFPIFLIGAHVPLNNVRYHSPWLFLITLTVAAAAGTLWTGGRRFAATALVLGLAGPAAWALSRLDWTPTPGGLFRSALDLPRFVATVAPRLRAEALTTPLADPTADAVRARLLGQVLGHDVRTGARPLAEVGPAIHDEAVAAGFGEAVITPCTPPDDVEAAAAALPAAQRAAFRRGASATLAFCDTPPPLDGAPPGYGSRTGRALVGACASRRVRTDAVTFATCLEQGASVLEDGSAAFYGAGRAWFNPHRDPAELEALRLPLGAHFSAFEAGTHDPAAGSEAPPFARETAEPGR